MLKKSFIIFFVVLLYFSLSSCSINSNTISENNNDEVPNINEIKLGEDYLGLKADLTVLTFRNDILEELENYAKEFNKIYPDIHIKYEVVSDYETSAITYLSSNTDWGDIMMIPLGIEKDTVSEYFIPLGNEEELAEVYNFTSDWSVNGQVYGLASTGNANGILYNINVFKEAGIESIPKTPDEFIEALKKIKTNTNAIPLYTNYADEWPMSSWDAYFGINSTGEENYVNQILVHSSAPFTNDNPGTGPYSVYKILYDAVSNGLTEEDYTTTSEPLSYQMLNNGEIGCLVFSSWAVTQAKEAGDNPEDIGFMPFPITVGEKQYVSINGDYSYGINKNISRDEKIASLIYVKWLIEKSNYSFNEGGLSVYKNGENPDFYDSLNECILMEDAPSLPGEEALFDELNRESGLLFNANGNEKVQKIVEHAFLKDKSFDQIMNEWNTVWNSAQNKLGIETN